MCVLSWGPGVAGGEEIGRKDTKMKSGRSHYLSLSLPLNKQLQRLIYSVSPNIQFPCYHITIS